eukprot:768768-Amphidinium_carterae.1
MGRCHKQGVTLFNLIRVCGNVAANQQSLRGSAAHHNLILHCTKWLWRWTRARAASSSTFTHKNSL